MIELKLATNNGVYRVERGDTIASVSKKFSTSKELLIKDNSLNGEIEVGDYLVVKSYRTVYTVQVEDTVESVAKKLGVTVDELLRVNKTAVIYPYMQVVCE